MKRCLVPILLKPKLLSIRNRWRGTASRRRIFQDLIILAFCLGLMLLIFVATRDVLYRVQLLSKLAYLPASQPLALIMLPLFAMLLFSNGVIAMGTLYLAADLELVLSSPLTVFSLFWGKFLYIMLNSSWMPFLFMAPVLLAFGIVYHAPAYYYLLCPLLLIPYFMIPTALAIVISTLLTLVIPAHRTKEVMLICVAMLLLMAYVMIDLLGLSGRAISGMEEIVRLVALFSASNTTWLPSTWAANVLSETLEPTHGSVFYETVLLSTSAAAAAALAFMVVALLHSSTYSKARNIRQKIRLGGTNLRGLLRRGLPSLQPHHQALITKEYRLFVREITQAVQLTLLLALCLIYLYNLRIFGAVDMLPLDMQRNWKSFFFIGNEAMGSFITTAICTRFVYPSISLEGRAYWLLVSGPLDVLELIKVKFWFWFTPVALISSAFFAAGAYTIGASPFVVLINIISACIICYGIVGLGIGLGAFFADFDWEHTSELAASFGSFIYMLMSILLILCSIVPAVLLVLLHQHGLGGARLTVVEWALASIAGMALLCCLNYLAARIALRLGEQSLLRHMRT